MKTIKILHISETFAAGVYTYIKDICGFFDNDPQFESYVIYSGNREDTNREKFEIDFSKKVHLKEISMQREISIVQDFRSIVSISKEIRKIKPDIIHLHSSKAGVLGRIASKAYPQAKVFYTPNGYSFVRQDISKSKRKLFRFIEFIVNKTFGGITIACGDTEFEHAKKIGKALLVRNGIEINSLRNFKKSKKSTVYTIGTVGRISPQKNPDLFNKIAEKFPNIKFYWIGDGEQKSKLSSNNIEITGWLNRENALEMVANLDLYIQTSSWEGLPFTIIEAMTIGKPIIATNVIGNKDAVKHGYNGYVCDSVQDFQKYIQLLKDNVDLKKSYGENSFIRANNLFDRNKNFIDLRNTYLTSF